MTTTPARSTFLLVLLASACRTEPRADRDFHTSGSREADQRAEQRVTKVEQMRGEKAADADAGKLSALWDRLGGEQGVRGIVSDFVERVVADPRVNWERKGIERGGVLGLGSTSAEWTPTPESKTVLAEHLVQFIAVATGGPSRYEGRDLTKVHADLKITNAEFDASIGCMKATLDAVSLGTPEQKELLAILESTRSQIATQR